MTYHTRREIMRWILIAAGALLSFIYALFRVGAKADESPKTGLRDEPGAKAPARIKGIRRK